MAETEREKRMEAAILDIDAHATPLGEDEDGFVSDGYLISVGCLHRALGLVGHTAPKRGRIPDEATIKFWRREVEAVEAERDAYRADAERWRAAEPLLREMAADKPCHAWTACSDHPDGHDPRCPIGRMAALLPPERPQEPTDG